MSIASSIYAEYAESKKLEWLEELKKAYEAKDWELIRRIIIKIDTFYFSE